MLAVVAAVLGAGVGVFAFLWSRTGARPVTVEEARRRFHDRQSTGPQSGGALVPAEGVYTYSGSGTERISIPPTSQSQGPEMPGTVVHGADGCWTFRIDYSSNHWQEWRYCARDGRLEELGGRTFERFDLVVTTAESLSTFACDPPSVVIQSAMDPGQTWRASCRGTSDAVEGTGSSIGTDRFVGRERILVDGRRVDAYHLVQRRTLSGAQRGTERTELWLGVDGLPLRNARRLRVETDSAIGAVTYTETGTFALVSLRPRA